MKTLTYGERLGAAMEHAGRSRGELAAELAVSVQAISQVLLGKTIALSAANSAVAADFLGVDHRWLATGDGTMLRHSTWPFSVDRSAYERLSSDQKQALDDTVGAFVRASLGKPKRSKTP